MIYDLFLVVLHMSFVASFVIVFVLVARLLLKKAPKIFSYALWSVVLIRLLCPFSFESEISLLPSALQQKAILSEWTDDYIETTNIFHDHSPEYDIAVSNGISPISAGEDGYYVVTDTDGISAPKTISNTILPKLSYIWIFGIAVLFIYSIVEFFKLKKKLIGATPLKNNIYIADHIVSPFVIGMFRPKIYLPSSLLEREQNYVIQHEKCHIKRLDHITRILGFIALSIHWFHPLVWIAFYVSGNDMEMSCDEAVINSMGNDMKVAYSQSLLRFSTSPQKIHGTPLAFGEGDTKSRIQNVLHYKKPIFWVSFIAFVAVALIAIGLMSNPKQEKPPTLYANSATDTIPMNLGAYAWDGVLTDSIAYTEMEYPHSISYDDGADRTANIFFSTSNPTSDVHTDNSNEENTFKIVEMKRYVNGEEEILTEFDDHSILVTLEANTSYLYQCKVQFGENYAYYSMKINNTVDASDGAKPLTNDQAVISALSSTKDSYMDGECFGEGHIILGTEKEDTATKIYALTMVGYYGFQNDNFIKLAGTGVIPAVITLQNNNTVTLEYPKDGSLYESSIKEMFPKKYHQRILHEKEQDKTTLEEQERSYAQEYLNKIGRTASIGDYGDFEHILLTDLGVPVEVSNNLFQHFSSCYPAFIGTQEYIENGLRVVYEMDYNDTQKVITFTKYLYDTKEVLEQFAFDAATGDVITISDSPKGL